MFSIDEMNPYILQFSHLGFMRNSDEEYQPFPSRITKWHELDIITFGHGYDVVSGKKYEVETGDVFYRTPGLTNTHYRPYYCFFMVFDPVYDSNRTALYNQGDVVGEHNEVIQTQPQKPIPIFSFADPPKLGKLSDIEPVFQIGIKLEKAFKDKYKDSLLIKSLFFQLLVEIRDQLIRSKDRPEIPSQYQQYARQIDIMTHNIYRYPAHDYTLSEMAAELHLSKNFFTKVFSSIVGKTPLAFVREVKLNHLKSLLLDTELSIGEISRECGMDENYIYVFFKHATGLTPIEYRKRGTLTRFIKE